LPGILIYIYIYIYIMMLVCIWRDDLLELEIQRDTYTHRKTHTCIFTIKCYEIRSALRFIVYCQFISGKPALKFPTVP